MTKHGLLDLTKTAALKTATTGVTVNAICLGLIRTGFLTRLIQQLTEAKGTTIAEEKKSGRPMQRILEPKDIADMAVYLTSDAARSITGQSLNVDGASNMN